MRLAGDGEDYRCGKTWAVVLRKAQLIAQREGSRGRRQWQDFRINDVSPKAFGFLGRIPPMSKERFRHCRNAHITWNPTISTWTITSSSPCSSPLVLTRQWIKHTLMVKKISGYIQKICISTSLVLRWHCLCNMCLISFSWLQRNQEHSDSKCNTR